MLGNDLKTMFRDDLKTMVIRDDLKTMFRDDFKTLMTQNQSNLTSDPSTSLHVTLKVVQLCQFHTHNVWHYNPDNAKLPKDL